MYLAVSSFSWNPSVWHRDHLFSLGLVVFCLIFVFLFLFWCFGVFLWLLFLVFWFGLVWFFVLGVRGGCVLLVASLWGQLVWVLRLCFELCDGWWFCLFEDCGSTKKKASNCCHPFPLKRSCFTSPKGYELPFCTWMQLFFKEIQVLPSVFAVQTPSWELA